MHLLRPVVPAHWIRQVSTATHLHLGESGNLEMEEAPELDYEEEKNELLHSQLMASSMGFE